MSSALDYFIWWAPFLTKAIIPYSPISKLLQPLVALVILYIITISLAKIKCSSLEFTTILKTSFKPIIIYIGLAVLSYASYFHIPILGVWGLLLNNIFLGILWAYVYKFVFNETFCVNKGLLEILWDMFKSFWEWVWNNTVRRLLP